MKYILVVDDYFLTTPIPTSRGRQTLEVYMIQLAARFGVGVQFLDNAESAVKIFMDDPNNTPSLILMDGHFGEGRMRGVEAVGRIRRVDQDVPIVMISGDQQSNNDGKAAGATDGLEKQKLGCEGEEIIRRLLVL